MFNKNIIIIRKAVRNYKKLSMKKRIAYRLITKISVQQSWFLLRVYVNDNILIQAYSYTNASLQNNNKGNLYYQ